MANNFAFQENKSLVENDITLTLKTYTPSFGKSFEVEHGYTILISAK